MRNYFITSVDFLSGRKTAILDDFLYERRIRRALRAISRQQVTMILNPGNVSFIERSPPREEWFEAAVRTCMVRGWVEVLHENVLTGQVTSQGLPTQFIPETHYKLTEGGWAVLNRTHAWVLATLFVSTVTLIVSAAALVVTCLSMQKP